MFSSGYLEPSGKLGMALYNNVTVSEIGIQYITCMYILKLQKCLCIVSPLENIQPEKKNCFSVRDGFLLIIYSDRSSKTSTD